MQSAAVLMALLNVAEPVPMGGFPNMLTEAFYPKSIRRSTAALDNINCRKLKYNRIPFLDFETDLSIKNCSVRYVRTCDCNIRQQLTSRC
jgi:hypothetical protein